MKIVCESDNQHINEANLTTLWKKALSVKFWGETYSEAGTIRQTHCHHVASLIAILC